MKVLQLVKYYEPSQGGMESVVKSIVKGIIEISEDFYFTIYSNNDKRVNADSQILNAREQVIKEVTSIYFKSQPLTIKYEYLRKLIANNDVIHHHYPFPTMEINLIRNLRLLKGKKFIITWHANINNSRWKWIKSIYNPIIVRLLKRADLIIVTSPQLFEASDLLKKYEKKIKIIPLCFDPKFESRDVKTYPSGRPFEILFVGKLRKYKGIDYLIKAITDLNVKLIIVGSGEEYKSLNLLVKELNIENKVEFISHANDNALKYLYNKSDLFVLPSINESEAFGVVQLEAMASAIPIINTYLKSGVPFVSLNEYSGITVKPADVDELKAAIQRITSSKELYELFSLNALERAKLFSRSSMVANYLEAYNK